MDVKTTKSNRWCLHIKDYAAKNNLSYRQAMSDDGCKSAYKSPPERTPSPPPSPEVLSEPVEKKKARAKRMEPVPDLPVTVLVRSEPYAVPLIPTVIKKERKRREAKMIPT